MRECPYCGEEERWHFVPGWHNAEPIEPDEGNCDACGFHYQEHCQDPLVEQIKRHKESQQPATPALSAHEVAAQIHEFGTELATRDSDNDEIVGRMRAYADQLGAAVPCVQTATGASPNKGGAPSPTLATVDDALEAAERLHPLTGKDADDACYTWPCRWTLMRLWKPPSPTLAELVTPEGAGRLLGTMGCSARTVAEITAAKCNKNACEWFAYCTALWERAKEAS